MTTAPTLATRLKRLPGQLLLALINATALLVIVACVLVIVVLNRVDQASERISATVTEAALSKLEMTPAALKERLQSVDGKVAALVDQLETAGSRDDRALTLQVAELNRTLNDLKAAAQNLGSAGPDITEAAFRQAGETLTETILSVRGCTAMQTDETPRN
ncbi:hypothetical protein [Roseibium sp. MMSF_3412]|uniref:hypothetical protein n=1 Tax=Roseibium sp. MMSF_3412 TaxID=3046712 RepID=UPI00273FBF0D|nr:hypothetical protein [Roseibium sp. MMSF_3412]